MKDFTVGGKPRHRRVFSEVLDIPIYSGLNKDYLFLAAGRDERIEKDFNQNNEKGTIHFNLPEDWDAAMEYAREFFGVEKTTKNEEDSDVDNETPYMRFCPRGITLRIDKYTGLLGVAMKMKELDEKIEIDLEGKVKKELNILIEIK